MNAKIDGIVQVEWPLTKERLLPPRQWTAGAPPSGKDFVSWNYRLTPGFPAEWPLPPNGELTYYAYAAGQLGSLVDGERTTFPWARVVLRVRDGNLKFERLAETPGIAGSQSVRPLRPPEVDLFSEAKALFDEFPDALRTNGEISPGPLEEKVKRCYGFWMECNWLIAREIRPLHASFFSWLGYGK